MDFPSSQACAICSNQPQDMLILSCSHNLCLDCATELFSASDNHNFLQCQICFASTPLDQETVGCLNSLNINNVVSQRSPEPNIPKPPKQVKIMQGLHCIQHREKSLYYCFDCQNPYICSECILGTSHSGHKVLTTKKATKIVAQKLMQYTRELQSLQKQINQESEWIKDKRTEIANQNEQRFLILKNVFDDMIRQVTNRYNILNDQLQKISQREIEIFEGSLNSIHQKYDLIQDTIRQNKDMIRKEDSQQILMRYSQLEGNKMLFKPELPVNFAQNHLVLTEQQNCLVHLEELLIKITWKETNTQRHQKQNNFHMYNIIKKEENQRQDIEQDQIRYQPQNMKDKSFNNSVNRYSGIKASSRRLELSRSMDNATNIINKLQQRIRK